MPNKNWVSLKSKNLTDHAKNEYDAQRKRYHQGPAKRKQLAMSAEVNRKLKLKGK